MSQESVYGDHNVPECGRWRIADTPKPPALAPSPRAVLHDLVLWQILGRSKFLDGAKVHLLPTNIGLS